MRGCRVASFVGVVLLAIGPAAPPAGAETTEPTVALPCHDYARIVETLEKRYGEAPQALGLQSNGHLLQVFISAAGSWTILTVAPSGIGCIVAAGRSWQTRPPAPLGPHT